MPSWYPDLRKIVHARAQEGHADLSAAALALICKVFAWPELGPIGQHGGWWDVAAWRRGLAGSPELLGAVDTIATGLPRKGDRAWITRDHVFSFLGRPVEMFVAAMAWGFGLSGYGWPRTAKIFTDEPRLKTLLGELHSAASDPGRTFAVITGPTGLRGLGPAFGTKLAYVNGYDRTGTGSGPLIADRWVAWTFWALTGEWDIRTSPDLYRTYVTTAGEWATALGSADQIVVRSDEVERALFVMGPFTLTAWRDRDKPSPQHQELAFGPVSALDLDTFK